MPRPTKPLALLLAVPSLAFTVAACGQTTSVNKFSGEAHDVAQAIANLQSDARSAEPQKLCSNDLAGAVVARLNATPGGCKQALKGQLSQIDNFDVTVESVQITAPRHTATARVKSTYNGKKTLRTVSLVYEGGKWKILSVI
jgi:NAD(P)H-dependent flavin oxidoreductase YrpB (nitropropane dioxygenase family)